MPLSSMCSEAYDASYFNSLLHLRAGKAANAKSARGVLCRARLRVPIAAGVQSDPSQPPDPSPGVALDKFDVEGIVAFAERVLPRASDL